MRGYDSGFGSPQGRGIFTSYAAGIEEQDRVQRRAHGASRARCRLPSRRAASPSRGRGGGGGGASSRWRQERRAFLDSVYRDRRHGGGGRSTSGGALSYHGGGGGAGAYYHGGGSGYGGYGGGSPLGGAPPHSPVASKAAPRPATASLLYRAQNTTLSTATPGFLAQPQRPRSSHDADVAGYGGGYGGAAELRRVASHNNAFGSFGVRQPHQHPSTFHHHRHTGGGGGGGANALALQRAGSPLRSSGAGALAAGSGMRAARAQTAGSPLRRP